jgi:hypothetical protein
MLFLRGGFENMKEGNLFIGVNSEGSLFGLCFSVYPDSPAAFGKEDDLDGFEEVSHTKRDSEN